MQDSTDTIITYTAIQKRAKQDALERMPDFPKVNTYEAWGSFLGELENLLVVDISHECSEWDWCIYYHRAMEVCLAVPTSVLNEAESEFFELGLGELDPELSGLYEMAAQLARLIVVREIQDALETARDELIDLAETQLENI